jgi:uncharacterized coiled-coil DUF342 family protein
MLTPEERKALQAQLDELQPKIRELKQKLNQLNDQKEKAFQQRNPVGKEISKLIHELKQLKQDRDQLTEEVKKLKDNRTGLNEIIKKKIEEAKKLNEERKKSTEKVGMRESPSQIKRLMDKLEMKIETEVISFEKEKALMKEIKELKKKYDELKQAGSVWDAAHQLSKDIDTMRDQSDDIHRQIQQKAKQSQEKHVRLLETSRTIDSLRGKGNTFTKDITESKGEIAKLSDELGALLKQAGELNTKLSAERKEKEAATASQRQKKFSEKLAEVKEKLKKGGKLTTEDIIIMQGEK